MIPLVLIAGFLGAGKTRFLSTVIPELHTRGLRVRVLLNDFENADIDSARLAELNALVTPLAGECVCCQSLEELLAALLAVPSEPDTVMLIEANGATEADELLARLTMDRRLEFYTLPLQLTVIDTKRWQKRWWHNTLEASQVKTATHVQLNWTERVKAERLQAVEASVRAVNARTAFTTPQAFADQLRELAMGARNEPRRKPVLPIAVTPAANGHTVGAHEPHVHSHPFASAVLPLPDTVRREQFLSFVRALPQAVVRAKGFVRFTDAPGEMFVWNRMEGRNSVSLDQSLPHASAQPVSLFIGVDLPLASLEQQIAALGVPALR